MGWSWSAGEEVSTVYKEMLNKYFELTTWGVKREKGEGDRLLCGFNHKLNNSEVWGVGVTAYQVRKRLLFLSLNVSYHSLISEKLSNAPDNDAIASSSVPGCARSGSKVLFFIILPGGMLLQLRLSFLGCLSGSKAFISFFRFSVILRYACFQCMPISGIL